MIVRLIVAFLLGSSCLIAAPQPQLSSTEVIRIADRAALSALHRDPAAEFTRRAPEYSADKRMWMVNYDNAKKTGPTQVIIEVSDTTRKTQVIFGDAF